MAHQAASLQLQGQPSISCIINNVSNCELSLTVANGSNSAQPEKGDTADVHFNNNGAGKLKIRASIKQIKDCDILLSFFDNQDPIVKQLVNDFNKLPPAYSMPVDVIQELTQLSSKQLGSLIEIYLEQTDSQLLTLAEAAVNNEQQNKLFEVKSLLRQHAGDIQRQYCELIRSGFEQHKQAQAPVLKDEKASIHENMELVDLDEFEDWLSLDKIIKHGNSLYYHSIACLGKRYGQLTGQSVSEENLPVSIRNLCSALQKTLSHYPIAAEMLPIIYQLFDKTIVNRLGDLYDVLNSRLKIHGILPNIESQQLREHRQQKRTVSTGIDITTPDADGSEPATDIATPDDNNELYSAATNILNLLHPDDIAEQTNAAAEAIDPQRLLEELTALQQKPEAVAAFGDGKSLQDILQEHSQLQLSGEIADRMQLISNVFQGISEYPSMPDSMVSQLKRLELPIAKMAVQDNSFFATTPDHPAKLLLNQLIEICQNSELPNKNLEKKFDRVIADVTDNFEQDSDVFQRALNDISSITDHQENAYQRNIERIAQTCDGRQRVQQAQNAVEREIQRRVSPPEAPEVIIDLIDNGWRELLKLTYIKMGQDSDAWKDHLATLDQLLMWLGDNDDSLSHPNLERELEADSFADLIAQQLNDVFPGDYRHQDSVENIRSTLKGHQPVTMVTLDGLDNLQPRTPNELQKELEAAHPQLKRWFKRAKKLQVGDEFSYLDKESGEQNIKLAWSSDNEHNFVFVNNLGQKILDLDLVDLANELSRGLSPVDKKSSWPVVERSLYSSVQKAYQQLAYNSSHDELTGLLSRKECERIISEAIVDAKNNSQQHCLLYIDIDQFSLANNLHGHDAGDKLLIDVSNILTEHLPEESVIARMAGNEFVVLLKQWNIQQSQHAAERLCKTVQNHAFSWQQHTMQFTISAGLMVINKYTESVVEMLRSAVSANQAAKEHGGNRVYTFRQDAELHTRREKLLSWIDKLSSVLNSDRLVLRGQKISPLSTQEEHSHYEILLAIRGENGELNSPVEFIEAAECYNRMQRVDRWVIDNTFSWMSKLKANNTSLPSISINLSGNSLNDDQFMDFILEQFAKYKIPTNKVCFEVTETATINNLTETADFLREIKRIGCKSALDDFGSGNASYQYLRHLPVDYLKIDGMFVKEVNSNKNDYALVKSIHEIAHLMGKKTIAEYAETDAIVDTLKAIGVDYGQGFALGKPTELALLYSS